jgi:hypothetical protein
MAGDRLLLFDNVEAGFSIGGSALDRVLTARTMKGRILGQSRMTPELPVDVVFYATGNNLGLRGDSLRRVVPCRLETAEERPEERSDFRLARDCPCGCRGDLLGHVKRARGRLVAAALAILRGYVAAGRPDRGLKPMDYPAWSGLIRNAVHWATGVDPCEARRELIADSDQYGEWKALLAGWTALCAAQGKTALTAAEARQALLAGDGRHEELRAIVGAWSKDDKFPSARTIGNRLKAIRGRNIDGSCLDYSPSDEIRRWYVRPAGSPPSTADPGSAGSPGSDPGSSAYPSAHSRKARAYAHGRTGFSPAEPAEPGSATGTPEGMEPWS